MANMDQTANQAKHDAKELANDAKNKAKDVADDARSAYETAKDKGAELLDNAKDKGREYADKAREMGEEYAEVAKDEARRLYRAGERKAHEVAEYAGEYYDEVETMVRRNPAQALGIAAGVGFLIGLILARR
ncbi:MAG: DUF883 domain-containing protein [Paracoccus sp. (in: a-proteobacteria)]|nr:DUF883 domain-containing protein [Paracoccus sp. (in: a-proteobacteria)]